MKFKPITYILKRFPSLRNKFMNYRLRNRMTFNTLNLILTYKCNLKCKYCYEEGLNKDIGEVSVSDFQKVVVWLKKNNKNKLIILGGEPTLHSKFKELMNIAEKNNIIVMMLTNFLFDEDTASFIASKKRLMLQANINHPDTYRSGQYDIVVRNLKYLNIRVPGLVLRYNIFEESQDYSYMVDLAKMHKTPIRFSIINSAIGSAVKASVTKDTIQTVYKKNTMISFLNECKQHGVNAYFARPVPACLFTEAERKELLKNNGLKYKCYIGRNGNYALRVNVNPDLTLLGCYGVPIKAPRLTEFESINSISDFYKSDFKCLRKMAVMEECNCCSYYINDECQGGCMSEKRDWFEFT